MKPFISADDSGSKSDEELVKEAEGTPEDTIIYELKIRCRRNPSANAKSKDPKDYLDTNVYTKSMKPIKRTGQTVEIGLIHDDILISKMRAGNNRKTILACQFKALLFSDIYWQL